MRENVITVENYDMMVRESDRPVLLIFWSRNEYASMKQRVYLYRLPGDENDFMVGTVCCQDEPDLANMFRVRDTPVSFILYKGSVRVKKERILSPRAISRLMVRQLKRL